jgi:lycopene cyclase domain-containing protein
VTYTVLAIIGVAVATLVDTVLLRTNLLRRKAFWTAYAIVLLFQLAVNGVLTGVPVVRYDDATILGIRVVYAPAEDLLFGFAMVLITLSGWVFLGRRGVGAEPARRARDRVSPRQRGGGD